MIMEKDQAAKPISPQSQTDRTLPDLHRFIKNYLYEIYDTTQRFDLSASPRDTFERRIKMGAC